MGTVEHLVRHRPQSKRTAPCPALNIRLFAGERLLSELATVRTGSRPCENAKVAETEMLPILKKVISSERQHEAVRRRRRPKPGYVAARVGRCLRVIYLPESDPRTESSFHLRTGLLYDDGPFRDLQANVLDKLLR